jgi:hypothetical protein
MVLLSDSEWAARTCEGTHGCGRHYLLDGTTVIGMKWQGDRGRQTIGDLLTGATARMRVRAPSCANVRLSPKQAATRLNDFNDLMVGATGIEPVTPPV